MAMLFRGRATDQTYACVSSEPEATCAPSFVNDSELTLALWYAQREVTTCKRSKQKPFVAELKTYRPLLDVVQYYLSGRITYGQKQAVGGKGKR